MKLSEFIANLQKIQYQDDSEVAIRVSKPGTSIGPSSREAVTGYDIGFDWDNKVIFLKVDNKLYTNLEKHNKAARAIEEIYGWLRSDYAKIDKLKIIENIVNHYYDKK